MFESIKRLIKGIRHPADKYETISKLRNNRGESSDELMKRYEDTIKSDIRMSYPVMTISDYMAYPTDTNKFPYRAGQLNMEEDDRIGAIASRIPNEEGEVSTWLTMYRIVPDPIVPYSKPIDPLDTSIELLKDDIIKAFSVPYHMLKRNNEDKKMNDNNLRIHNHPWMEKELSVPVDHVIIDAELYMELMNRYGDRLPVSHESSKDTLSSRIAEASIALHTLKGWK